MFYLARVMRELEDKVNLNHENLAKGAPHYVFQKMKEQSIELANEYEAMNWLYNFVNETEVK